MKVSQKSAKRYAQSLFQLSQEEKSIDSVYNNLQMINHLIDQSQEFASFLQNPTIPTEKRQLILKEILENKLDALTYRFILFLERKNRLAFLKNIFQTFEELYFEAKGILKVTFTSRWALTSEEVQHISQHLKDKFHKDIVTQLRTDDTILGGVKIQIGDFIYDFSLQTQLNKFKQSLLN